VTNEFFPTGEIKKTYGARTYPVEYTYDPQGRMKTMKTWKNFAGNSGAATTTWNYDTNRAFLLSKVYDDGRGTTNQYTAAGRLRTRSWARGITTTYTTNSAGDIANITYSDGATPNVTNTFDRAGRHIQVNQGTNITTLLHSDVGQLLSETLNGVTVTNTYDSLRRRSSVSMSGQSSTLANYAYDAASRLSYATNGQFTSAYSYLANSPLVSQIVFKSNSVTRMTTTKTYDFLNRLQSISSVPSAQTPTSVSAPPWPTAASGFTSMTGLVK
jgi:YD repeat-containing protein